MVDRTCALQNRIAVRRQTVQASVYSTDVDSLQKVISRVTVHVISSSGNRARCVQSRRGQ